MIPVATLFPTCSAASTVSRMRRFLIDTDTASDDAVAIVMALRAPDVQVEALTVVAGNVALDQAVQNALYTVELCGADTPVYVGADAPMARDLQTAQEVHGEDGMGDLGLPALPSQGNFVLVGFADAAAMQDRLRGRGILVRQMGGYGLPGHLRITIGTDAEMAEVSEAIAEFLG